MFKYLWIVMLVLLVCGFIGYTAVCLGKCVLDTIDYYGTLNMKNVKILTFINHVWDEFTCWYDTLCMIWVVIFIVVAIVLFVTSLCSFLPEPPAE